MTVYENIIGRLDDNVVLKITVKELKELMGKPVIDLTTN